MHDARTPGLPLRRTAGIPVLVLALAFATAFAVGPGPASAGPPTPDIGPWTFTCDNGQFVDFTLPAGPYDAVVVVAAGGSGARGGDIEYTNISPGSGGAGGMATGVVAAGPGHKLEIGVGCAGSGSSGRPGGGGNGGDGGQITDGSLGSEGGGGGGASQARNGSGAPSFKLTAGGGGGGGGIWSQDGGNGGHGGRAPTAGGSVPAITDPNNPTIPGNSGGCGGCNENIEGNPGGTNGGGPVGTGGGGGGGCRGGAGGGAPVTAGMNSGAGGGGGSSCHEGAIHDVTYRDGSNAGGGFVTITPAWYASCSGSAHDVVIPDGWSGVVVTATGAQGGHAEGSASGGAGKGGRTSATAPVTPGDTIAITPGCAGGNHSGFGAGHGGAGGSVDNGGNGARGGGGTAVAKAGTWTVTGGGGGGAGSSGVGGTGGTGGHGGTTPEGGTAGEPGGQGGGFPAVEGANGAAGAPGSNLGGGGGGGGGGCKGGGGGAGTSSPGGGGGGGGASSCVTGTAKLVASADGHQEGDGFATVALGTAGQPDGTIAGLGDDVHNTDGAGQTATAAVTREPGVHEITFEHEGALPSHLVLHLPEAPPGFHVTYAVTSPDGTADVAPGTDDLVVLASGETATVEMRVTRDGAPIGTTFDALVTATSLEDPSLIDAVRAVSVLEASGPDAQVRKRNQSEFAGIDIYNLDGAGQTVTKVVRAGKATTFVVRIVNEGPESDRFRVVGTTTAKKFTARYTVNGADVTTSIAFGLYRTPELAPGEELELVVKVSASAQAKPGQGFSAIVNATSLEEASDSDTVIAGVTAK